MAQDLDEFGTIRLKQYLDSLGTHLKDVRKRESFAIYAFGILGESARKSVEPMAALACPDPERAKNMHHKLVHFVSKADWSDHAVRRHAARHLCDELEKHEPVTTWVVDDTGFLKQGTHSVGVQRQYTGSAGKVTNCQIGVSLAIATATQHAPIDFELYLPESWTNDPERCQQARVPSDVEFKTKLALALGMIERAVKDQVPGDIILADGAYGDSCEFRSGVRALGLDYAVGIHSTTLVCRICSNGRIGKSMSALELARTIVRRKRRKLRWREGTQGTLWGRFSFVRVRTLHDDGTPIDERQEQWLVVEWPLNDDQATKFYLTTLPRRMSHKQIVRQLKERWRTERMYEDLKGELGLDHYEGRSWTGWHHHISVVICCYAFIAAEKARAFPPSARRQGRADALQLAA